MPILPITQKGKGGEQHPDIFEVSIYQKQILNNKKKKD
jgi:hypothetical protein